MTPADGLRAQIEAARIVHVPSDLEEVPVVGFGVQQLEAPREVTRNSTDLESAAPQASVIVVIPFISLLKKDRLICFVDRTAGLGASQPGPTPGLALACTPNPAGDFRRLGRWSPMR